MRLTTIILIILFIVVTALSCFAQITIESLGKEVVTTGKVGLSTGIAVSYYYYPSKVDTIKSYLLVTHPIDECSGYCMMTERIIGYEVINRRGSLIADGTIEWHYLDGDKKPFDKSVTVWMSKPIERGEWN